jgi:hypothetical protein
MQRKKFRLMVWMILVFLILFFVGYSMFFRTFIDTQKYLQIAWDYTGHDPHVLNWQEPDVNVVWQDGRILVHLVLHTDEDRQRGPYSLYIDPFQQAVVAEDPRR